MPIGVIGLHHLFQRRLPGRKTFISLLWDCRCADSGRIWYGPVIWRHGWLFIDRFLFSTTSPVTFQINIITSSRFISIFSLCRCWPCLDSFLDRWTTANRRGFGTPTLRLAIELPELEPADDLRWRGLFSLWFSSVSQAQNCLATSYRSCPRQR